MKKGISLIVLVITIIVLIILTAGVIMYTTGNNGIINRAQNVSEGYNEKIAMEKLMIALSSVKADSTLEGKALADYLIDNDIVLDNITYEEDENGLVFHLGDYAIATDKNGNLLSIESDEGYEANTFVSGVEKPKLAEGMTPVYWNGNTEIETTEDNPNWYDYDNNRWANVKMSDGSYFVWIPRYEYKINQRENDELAGTIDVNFVAKNDVTATEGYVIHPAFRNDVDAGGWDSEISGIWVAKYEASGTLDALESKPGVHPIIAVWIGDAYEASLEYNSNVSSHLIKNSEWGATVMFAHSKYGRDGVKIAKNDNSNRYTAGSSGATATRNVDLSTTGNPTGVFDMCGGINEVVAAYVPSNDICDRLKYGKTMVTDNPVSSKFVTLYIGSSSFIPEDGINSIKGDALYELSGPSVNSWFNSLAHCVVEGLPYFRRGGYYTGSACQFDSYDSDGSGGGNIAFRIVLVP